MLQTMRHYPVESCAEVQPPACALPLNCTVQCVITQLRTAQHGDRRALVPVRALTFYRRNFGPLTQVSAPPRSMHQCDFFIAPFCPCRILGIAFVAECPRSLHMCFCSSANGRALLSLCCMTSVLGGHAGAVRCSRSEHGLPENGCNHAARCHGTSQ